jgi:outer membrane protein
MRICLAIRTAAVAAVFIARPGLSQSPVQHALSLGDAARLAVRQSVDAVTARLRVAEDAAKARQERADLLPDVSGAFGDGQRTYNTASFGIPFPGFDPNGQIIGPVRTVDVRARVVMSLFDPVAFGEYRHANATTGQAEADAAAAGERVAATAVAAYVRVLHAQSLMFGATMDSTTADELLAIAKEQLAGGIGVALDVTRAQTQAAEIRLRLIAVRNERDRARLDLLRAVGLPLDSDVALTDSLGPPLPGESAPSDSAAVARALERRPVVHAAAAAVEAARRARATDRAYRLPSIAAFADKGITSNSYGNLLGTYNYGVQLSVPVFDGFKTRARVEEADAVLEAAEARERDARQQVILEVRRALVDQAAARQQVSAAQEHLQLAQQELDQARERFRVGITGNADVISAQLALGSSRGALADALAASLYARVALAAAEGELTTLP